MIARCAHGVRVSGCRGCRLPVHPITPITLVASAAPPAPACRRHAGGGDRRARAGADDGERVRAVARGADDDDVLRTLQRAEQAVGRHLAHADRDRALGGDRWRRTSASPRPPAPPPRAAPTPRRARPAGPGTPARRQPCNASGTRFSTAISSRFTRRPMVRARMSALRATSSPLRSSRGSGSVKPFAFAERTASEKLAPLPRSVKIAPRVPESAPTISTGSSPRVEQRAQGRDHRQPRAAGRLVAEVTARSGGGPQLGRQRVLQRQRQGRLVGEDHPRPRGEGAGIERRRSPRRPRHP